MSEILTVIIGVSIFVIGQMFIRFVVEPIHAQWKLRGEIDATLTFYANASDFVANLDEDEELLRQQASVLRANPYTIPAYRIWTWARLTIPRGDVHQASVQLIGLSNSLGDRQATRERHPAIRTLLKLSSLG